MTPLYEHDCTNCRFLGTDIRRPGEPACNSVDLYACEGTSGAIVSNVTLIRRYSSEGSNYGAVPLELVRHQTVSDRYHEVARRYLEGRQC
jgi:hypothetical protein